MRALHTVPLVVAALVALSAVPAAAQPGVDPFWNLHSAAYVTDEYMWEIQITEAKTYPRVFHRDNLYPSMIIIDHMVALDAMPMPPTADWPAGVQLATYLQSQNKNLFPTSLPIVSATWTKEPVSRVDTMTFTTNAGSTFTYSSLGYGLVQAAWKNCGNQRHCWGGEELCCGGASGAPECLPVNSNKTCCDYNDQKMLCQAGSKCCRTGDTASTSLAATCCNGDAACCTSQDKSKLTCCNSGTSCCSSTFEAKCCGTGATCCKSKDYAATCCEAGTTCCSNDYGMALCCTADQVCDVANYRCAPRTTTSAAPTVAPNPNAEHRVCFSFSTAASGTVYYDVRTGPAGTSLQRWRNGQLLDTNGYATLHMPTSGQMWNEGVGYAATMQTRNAWPNNEPTQTATWEVVGGEDVWRFSTSVNGSPLQLVFRSGNCVDMTAAPATGAPSTFAPPVTLDPNGPHRVCTNNRKVTSDPMLHYEIRTGPSGTVFERWHGNQLLDTNTYATLHMPTSNDANGQPVWDEGVGFAAAMQTRNVWLNNGEPTQAAYWRTYPAGANSFNYPADEWRFNTQVNGGPVQYVFHTRWCRN